MTFSKSEPIKACSICGNVPSATVQVGGSIPLGWLECRPCGKKTRDGQTFEQARWEWNRELA
ncbi:MAG TPA: hypothetical protein VF756_01370 [Thermoanaerobaculia bacterium]